MEGEQVAIMITDDQIQCQSKGSKFATKLYDSNLAKNSKNFYKPENFKKYQDTFQEGIEISQDVIKKLKATCNLFAEKEAYVLCEEGKVDLRIGKTETNSYEINLGESDNFIEEFKCIKDLFTLVKRGNIELCESSCGKIISIREEIEATTKYIFTSKLK